MPLLLIPEDGTAKPDANSHVAQALLSSYGTLKSARSATVRLIRV